MAGSLYVDNIGGGTPAASAAFQFDSETGGLLPPRMTTAQRTAIATPAESLLVFDTDLSALYMYDGGWVVVSSGGGGGGAPANATYITQTPNSGLSNEQALSTLATGAMQVTTATGVVSSRPNGVTSTATAAGTTTLTAASEQTQIFTGTTTQTCVLPDATTLAVGWVFRIRNTSTGAVTVNANGGSLVVTLAASQEALLICTDIGSAAGTWSMSAVPPTGAFTTLSAFTTGSFPFTMTSDGSSSGFANAAYNGSGTATNNDPRVLFRRAQGSYNSPSAVVNNDRLGAFNWQGWDGDEFYTAAAIFAFVNGTVANDSVPARMTFELIRAAGATSRSEYMGFKGTETVFNDDSADIDFRVESDGSTSALFVDGGNNRVAFFTSAPSYDVSIGGNAARTLSMERHTTSNTAGNNLTVSSGGATSGATNKAAGALILTTGINTGNAIPASIRLQAGVMNPTSGTGDNANVDRWMTSSKVLTNNSAITILNATAATLLGIGGIIRYSIEVTNGTDIQMETGFAVFSGVNKGGAFTVSITEVNSQQSVSAGTLTTTWAISSANPAAISINANSSLTPSTGYPRITYSVENFSQQAIAAA